MIPRHVDISKGFTVRVPFQIRSSATISGLDEPANLVTPGAQGRLLARSPHYILEFSGLPSEADAEQYTRHVLGALYWTSLDLALPIVFEREPGTVVWAEDPVKAAENINQGFGTTISGPLDGIADGAQPTIYPSSASLRFAVAGTGTAVGGFGVDVVLRSLQQGLVLQAPILESRLETSLSLYLAHFGESTMSAQLLTLTMCLEALTEGEEKAPVALQLLEKWHVELAEKRREYEENSEEHAALSALERDHFFLRANSIGSQVRSVVRDALTRAGASDVKKLIKVAVEVYGKRSELVHNGTLPRSELLRACTDAQDVVRRVLRARLAFPSPATNTPSASSDLREELSKE